MRALLLATEAAEGGLSFGTQLRGWLVAIFSVILFCGSVYMLLATNVGRRLGLLLSLSAIFGFLSMLGMIWFTNLTPLTALHGPAPKWEVKEVLAGVGENETAKRVDEQGKELDALAQGEIKASIDTALTEEDGEFFKFSSSTDYIVVDAKSLGGGNDSFFKHKPHYATMQVQPVVKVTPLPGQAPPPPAADEEAPVTTVFLQRDLGALRQPTLFMSLGFGILFAITCVLLHKGERAQQIAERDGTSIEPAPVMA